MLNLIELRTSNCQDVSFTYSKKIFMSLPVKNWISETDSRQKFLATVLAYGLSKKLDRRHYEAVNESHIDLQVYQSDIPDVIVYDIKLHLKPVLIVELCSEAELESTIRTVEIISTIYGIRESFVFNITNNQWKRIDSNSIVSSSQSTFFNIDLQEILSKNLYTYF